MVDRPHIRAHLALIKLGLRSIDNRRGHAIIEVDLDCGMKTAGATAKLLPGEPHDDLAGGGAEQGEDGRERDHCPNRFLRN